MSKITEELKEKYSRCCPNCGEKIYYKWMSDYYSSNKKGTCCRKCYSVNFYKTKFKKGHTLNEKYSYIKRSFNY